MTVSGSHLVAASGDPNMVDLIDEAADARAAVTIVTAADHAVVRAGLRMLLGAEPGFNVVAEATDVAAAVQSVLGHKPRVVVLDLSTPTAGRSRWRAPPTPRG